MVLVVAIGAGGVLCRSFIVRRVVSCLSPSFPSCCYHGVLLFRVVSRCCSCSCPCGCCVHSISDFLSRFLKRDGGLNLSLRLPVVKKDTHSLSLFRKKNIVKTKNVPNFTQQDKGFWIGNLCCFCVCEYIYVCMCSVCAQCFLLLLEMFGGGFGFGLVRRHVCMCVCMDHPPTPIAKKKQKQTKALSCVCVCMCGDGPTNRLRKKNTKKHHCRNIYALTHRNKKRKREKKKTTKKRV